MKTPYFIEKIDWSDLRTQKTLMLETINNDAVDPEHKEALEGILALIDALQDYAVDEMDIPAMHVFDFELEEERENESNEKLAKTVILCGACHSNNVELKRWVNPNTNEVGDYMDDNDDSWCCDCETNSGVYGVDFNVDAKVIGFQVVGKEGTDKEGEIHPNMDASFCVYNLSWCMSKIESIDVWELLTIWEGDIEEPTMMFDTDPRD